MQTRKLLLQVGLAVVIAAIMVCGSALAVAGTASAGALAPAAPTAVSAPVVASSVTPSTSSPAAGGSGGGGVPVNSQMLTPSGLYTGALAINTAREANIDALRTAFVAAGNSASDFFPPSLLTPPASPAQTGGHIIPTETYPNAPAPMGLGFYGLQNISGQLRGTIFNTTSIEGYTSMSDPWGTQVYYQYYSGNTSFGGQLNCVLVNMTIQGLRSENYQYWQQNVIGYNPTSHSLSFENNIWNFSNPSNAFPANGILKAEGTFRGGSPYAVSGLSITIPYPFTLAVYINTTVNYTYSSPSGSCVTYGCNEVWYNYSVWNAAGQHVCPTGTSTSYRYCGAKGATYDNVIFNSQSTSHHVYVPLGSAQLQANGLAYNPFQYLPNDYEWTWGIGSSDGSEMNDYYSNITLGLDYLNSTTGRMTTVPAAYDFGSETGESSDGTYDTWHTQSNGAPIATMTAGPSILQGLWNLSTPSGADAVNYAGVQPGNAWIAIGPGAGNTNTTQLKAAQPLFAMYATNVPYTRGLVGPNIYLSPGTYTVNILLSGYVQQNFNIVLTPGEGTTFLTNHLVRQGTPMAYTPLYAYSNQDLANLSQSGSGTAASPYVIHDASPASMSGIFAEIESYYGQIWNGIQFNNTRAHVNLDPVPTLAIAYPAWLYGKLQNYSSVTIRNIPLVNQLQMLFKNCQNVTIANGVSIGGWFITSAAGGFGPFYAVQVINGKNFLVYKNFFNTSAEGLEFIATSGYSNTASNNTVWGNTFTQYSMAAYPALVPATTVFSDTDVGTFHGDHIYNNAFYSNQTAAFASATVHAFWNVTGGTQPTSFVNMVNGYALTGANILGQNYQGGNYWFNYGATPNPYGFIPYVARVSSPTGTAEIGLGGDFAPLSPYGKVGAGIYHVTFTETGAGVGNWTTRIFNVPVIKPLLATTYFTNPSNTTVISASVRTSSFWLPNGTYTWTNVLTTSIQATGTTSGSVTVNGAATGVSNTLVQLYPARGTETGLVSPNVRWYVNVTGLPSATSTAATNIYYLPNGTYTYTVAAGANLNYHTNITGGSFVVASHVVTKNVTVTFTPVTYAVTFTETGLPASTLWYVNGTGQVAASSTVTTLTAQFLNGTIAYTIATANKNYAVNAIHATIVVAGAPLAGPTLAFSVFSGNVVTFFEGPPGLPVNAAWAVGLNGGVFGTTGAMFQFPTYNGTSTFTISAPPGYTANRTSGSLTVHGATGAGATTEIGFTATGYAVTYTEVGLVPGTSWSVTLNSVVHTSTTNTISFTETTGTYSYTIGAIAGTAASPSSGTVTVTNVPVSVAITYSSVSYTVSFTEGGTYAGPWAVQLGGVLKSAASGTISFTEPNGTYAYMVASVAGYTAAPSSGSIPVAGSGSSTSITFSTAAPPTYSLQFTENGLVLGTSWSVTVTGQGTLSSTGTTITFSALVAGTYTYSYGAVAGFTTPTGGAAVITTASVSLAVTYSAPTFAVTFTESGLPSGTAWAVAFAGQITVTTGTSIVFHVAAGTYSYSVATTSGYAPSPASGTLIVSGATPVAITYTLIPPVPSALSASTPVAVSARSD